jgi:hypothetical protein
MRTNVILAVLLAAGTGATAGACDPTRPSDCPDSVDLTVSQGSIVVFDWKPSCRGGTLSVTDVESLELVWLVQDVGRPPVTYGQAPAGSREAFPALPLHPGKMYDTRLDVPRDGRTLYVGAAEFVSQR